MNIKNAALGIISRILRFAGILLVIYVSMVFYLALTERRNAYPRAITHNEAREAIASTTKPVSCTLEDGTVLEGWTTQNADTPVLLYYPDADEDAAQFLAEVQNVEGLTLAAFNYRGSGNNKGTPSAETFAPDANKIAECASQINGQAPLIFAGRGTGAIVASMQTGPGQKLLLIDPAISIADAIATKYRFLYPKFLVRAKEAIPTNNLVSTQSNITILLDRKIWCDRAHKVIEELPLAKVVKRDNNTLQNALSKLVPLFAKSSANP